MVSHIKALYFCYPTALSGNIGRYLSAIMGVGDGFTMMLAITCLLGMPTKVVVGTSLLKIIFVTTLSTLLHATNNYVALETFEGIIAHWRCYWCPSWNAPGYETEGRTALCFTSSDGFRSMLKAWA